jgi:hypothetical protein
MPERGEQVNMCPHQPCSLTKRFAIHAEISVAPIGVLVIEEMFYWWGQPKSRGMGIFKCNRNIMLNATTKDLGRELHERITNINFTLVFFRKPCKPHKKKVIIT